LKHVATPVSSHLLAPEDLRRLLEGITAGEEAYLRIPARVEIADALFTDRAAISRSLDRQLQKLDLHPIPVTPDLAPASAEALDLQLQGLDLTPLKVPVTPQLDPKAVERLGAQLDAIDLLPERAAPVLVPDAGRTLEKQLDALKGETGIRSGIDLVPSEKLIAILEEMHATVRRHRSEMFSSRLAAGSPFPPIPDECLAHPLASFYFAQSGRIPGEVVCADIGDDRNCIAASATQSWFLSRRRLARLSKASPIVSTPLAKASSPPTPPSNC
jgi:hypothetical protein